MAFFNFFPSLKFHWFDLISFIAKFQKKSGDDGYGSKHAHSKKYGRDKDDCDRDDDDHGGHGKHGRHKDKKDKKDKNDKKGCHDDDDDGVDPDDVVFDNPNAGGELVEGTGGDDVISVGDEGFTVEAGDGNDNVSGGLGDDRILGGAGDDNALAGNAGDDVVDGGDGDDDLLGNRGNDILLGGNGNDRLSGGQGDDILVGGDGDDVLTGSRGNDELYGGAGSDIFFFRMNEDFDVIKDFDVSGVDVDQIDVTLFGDTFDTFAEIQSALTEADGNVTFTLLADQSIVIENVAIADLSADNFVL